MHCPILFHEDHGMMEIIEIDGKGGAGQRHSLVGVGKMARMNMTLNGGGSSAGSA
jgi:hypothetical protein